MVGDGSAEVGGGGWAGKAHATAPVVAGGDEHKGKEPARQRLGLSPEALMDTTAALFAEEDATAVLTMSELAGAVPGRPLLGEEPDADILGVGFPALALDAL